VPGSERDEVPVTRKVESTKDGKDKPRTRGIAQKIIRKRTTSRSASAQAVKKSTAMKAATDESVALLTLHSGAVTLNKAPAGFGVEAGSAVRRSTRQAAKARRGMGA